MGEGVDAGPSLQPGRQQPPGGKKLRLVSWAWSQLICSIVCSGHPLGQQGRRQEKLVLQQPQSMDYCPGTSFRGRNVKISGGGWSRDWLLPHSRQGGERRGNLDPTC